MQMQDRVRNSVFIEYDKAQEPVMGWQFAESMRKTTVCVSGALITLTVASRSTAISMEDYGLRLQNTFYYAMTGIEPGTPIYRNQAQPLCNEQYPWLPQYVIVHTQGWGDENGATVIRASVNAPPSELSGPGRLDTSGACPAIGNQVVLNQTTCDDNDYFTCRFPLNGGPYAGNETVWVQPCGNSTGPEVPAYIARLVFPASYFRSRYQTRFTVESVLQPVYGDSLTRLGTFGVVNNCDGCLSPPVINGVTFPETGIPDGTSEGYTFAVQVNASEGCDGEKMPEPGSLGFSYQYQITFSPDYNDRQEQAPLLVNDLDSPVSYTVTFPLPQNETTCLTGQPDMPELSELTGQVVLKKVATALNPDGSRPVVELSAVHPVVLDRNGTEIMPDLCSSGYNWVKIAAIAAGVTLVVTGGVITTAAVFIIVGRYYKKRPSTAAGAAGTAALILTETGEQQSRYTTGVKSSGKIADSPSSVPVRKPPRKPPPPPPPPPPPLKTADTSLLISTKLASQLQSKETKAGISVPDKKQQTKPVPPKRTTRGTGKRVAPAVPPSAKKRTGTAGRIAPQPPESGHSGSAVTGPAAAKTTAGSKGNRVSEMKKQFEQNR